MGLFLQSALQSTGLPYVMDVSGGSAAAGTNVDVYPMHYNPSAPSAKTDSQQPSVANQLWNLIPGPENTFSIQSTLPGNPLLTLPKDGGAGTLLVIDPVEAGLPGFTQLWVFVPVSLQTTLQPTGKDGNPQGNPEPFTIMVGSFIQSFTQPGLVIDVQGGEPTKGGKPSMLQVFPKNATPQNGVLTANQLLAVKNQLWVQTPSYIPVPG